MGSLASPHPIAPVDPANGGVDRRVATGDAAHPAGSRAADHAASRWTPSAALLPNHIPALDALRGIAVLLIVARHASAVAPPTGALSAALFGTMRAGWVGVDLFFALSGFLITGILIDTKGAPGYLRNFYARRTLRIFPLYFAVLGALFLIGPLTPLAGNADFRTLQDNQWWLWSYLTNVLIVVQGHAAVPLHLSHLWSLALEEQFYLFWPFVVLAVPARLLPRAILALSAFAVVLRAGLVAREGWGLEAAYILMPSRLDALLIGGGLAWMMRSVEGRLWVRRLQRPVGVAAFALLAGLALWRGAGSRTDPYIQVFGYAALSFLGATLIAIALPGGPAGRWRALLSAPWLQSLGKYSYAIYVFQYPVIHGLDLTIRPTLDAWSGGAVLPVAITIFVLATALSYLAARISWVLVEGPALALKRHFPSRVAA